MPDFLTKLIADAEKRIKTGYYDIPTKTDHQVVSLEKAIQSAEHNAVIAEIKPISPARGALRPDLDPVDTAVKFAEAGAVALSVLTEPDNFGGRINSLAKIRPFVTIPVLMKDIIIDRIQIEAASNLGADSILLIESAFSENRATHLHELIDSAHDLKQEVLLEVHDEDQFSRALQTAADLIGVNNRNLSTLKVDLDTTRRILAKVPADGRVLISESGIEDVNDLHRLKSSPVDGFLIGSSIMLADDLTGKLREFIYA